MAIDVNLLPKYAGFLYLQEHRSTVPFHTGTVRYCRTGPHVVALLSDVFGVS
jgi:hypothetical protein